MAKRRIILALIGLTAFAADLRIESYKSPTYPPLARLARIAGTVILEFSINPQSEPSAITLVSGHPILAPSTQTNLATWRFSPSTDTIGRHRVTYIFEFSPDFADGYYNPKQERVQFEGTEVVRVTTAPNGTLSATECPDGPPQAINTPVSANDFITLSRSGCYGTCPSYEVKVYGDGRIIWNGHNFVEASGEHLSRIPEAAATELLQKFQTQEVQVLCGDYSQSITDSASTQVEIAIGNHVKKIHDYANSSPSWFQYLQTEIDRVAATHELRHGNPAHEPLLNIQQEYLPKPGTTALMSAAARANINEMRQLIASGASVDDRDSSGWTALMYAASSYSGSDVVEELIRSGANPKHASPAGDTVLMAASLTGLFDEDLAKSGTHLNAQNQDGVTALMLLAARGEPDEIKAALKAGANAKLLDRNRHSALDYLEATKCNQSLVRGYKAFLETTGPCTATGDEDYRKSHKLLKSAMRRRQRDQLQ